MTDTRDAFEAWFTNGAAGVRLHRVNDEYTLMTTQISWIAWQAAIKAELERCALVCEKVDSEQMAKVKQTGQNHYEDYAIGAELCTTAIRSNQ